MICPFNDPHWSDALLHQHRVTLKEGKADQPPPSHVWSGSLIAKACPGDWITEAVVLAPGEVVLFFRRHSLKEGLLYNNAWDVEFGLSGLVSWVGITALVEVSITTMKVIRQLWMPLWSRKWRPVGLWTPKGWGELPSPQLLPIMLMIGCVA